MKTMPELTDLRLRASRVELPDSRHLHGLACAFFEGAEDPHHGPKPFAASARVPESDRAGGRLLVRFGWLRDDPPQTAPSSIGEVQLGNRRYVIEHVHTHKQSFAELSAGPPAISATLTFRSPTYFSSSGADVRVPDPRLIVGSYRRRWNAALPEGSPLMIDEDLWQRLRQSLDLEAFDLRTAAMNSGYNRRVYGFVGSATLRLHAGPPREVRVVFAALLRFATYAGTGAQTTHGFGATDGCVPASDRG